ncbi:MAG: VOC family protein [Actinomycetota bacterium]|nr:VOC family protein [Actinomycetota bacterium]
MILEGTGLRGVDHIGLTVPDLDEAIAFFGEAFGATVLFRHGAYSPRPEVNERNFARARDVEVAGIAMIRILDMNIELLQYRTSDPPRTWPSTSSTGGHHVAFYVEQLEEAVDRMREAGIEVLGEPLPLSGPEGGPGNRFVYARAPWGLFIELVSYPGGKAHDHASV